MQEGLVTDWLTSINHRNNMFWYFNSDKIENHGYQSIYGDILKLRYY